MVRSSLRHSPTTGSVENGRRVGGTGLNGGGGGGGDDEEISATCDACNNTIVLSPDNNNGIGTTGTGGNTGVKQNCLNSTTHQVETMMTNNSTDEGRLPFSQDEFYKCYQFQLPEKLSPLQKISRSCSCSTSRLQKHLKKLFPIFNWLPNYNYKNDFLVDIIAGITLAIVQIPQAMAFAMLSNASPVMGLYATFYASAVYFFLGTSKFSSLGMAGVTALVVGEAINEQLNRVQSEASASASGIGLSSGLATGLNHTDVDTEALKTQVATTMAFIVGILQITMGLLKLGSLSIFFSDVMMRACTMAAVTQMIISQTPTMLGIKITRQTGPLSTVYNVIDICTGISRTNMPTLVTSIVSLIFLILINEGINARYKHKLKIPIPTEIILIACGTAISYFVSLNINYNVKILNYVPIGLPSATPPRFDLIPSLLSHSIVVTILTFTIIMSQAKVLSCKYDCFPDISQELFANGVANIIGSFFSSLPCSFAFVRCMLLIHLKARSLLCSLVCAITLLLALLYIAPIFQPLPHCILAAILVFALAEILLDLKLIPKTWKSVRTDSFVIIFSYLGVFLLDLQFGIAVGMLVSMIMVLFKTMSIKVSTLGLVHGTDLYLDVDKYQKARELENIKIFYIGGSLFFGTKDTVKKTIEKQFVKLEKSKMLKYEQLSEKTPNYNQVIGNLESKQLESENNCDLKSVITIENFGALHKYVILDCSAVIFIDTSAIRTMGLIKEELEKVNAQLLLAACSNKVIKTLEMSEIKGKVEGIFYPTVHDAVLAAQMQIKVANSLAIKDAMATECYDNPTFVNT